MTRAALLGAAPAILLAACILLPFHDKAFTIDDTFFLRGAQQAVDDPLHPTAFEIVWFDAPERVGPTGGPLMAWLLMPAVLSARSESVAHAVQLLFLGLALLGTVAFAIRLGMTPPWAMAAGLLLAATPTALGMAGTAMADVPAMALGVLGLERLAAWKQDGRSHQALLAAVFLGLGPLARPHAILILGIGGLLLVGDFLSPASWRRTSWTLWLPLAGAVALTASVLVLTWDHAPGAPGLFGATSRMSSAASMGPNAVAFATHWVLALPLALPWLALRPLAVLRRWWLLLIGGAAMVLLLEMANRRSLPNAVIAALGIAVLWDLIADGWKRRDPIQVGLGLWLLLPLAPLPYPHLPAKYHLASAPAAAILVAREMAVHGALRAKLVLGATAAFGLALGVAILRADAAFADLGRRAAAELIGPQVESGHRVWFVGHWGFQWYAERAGARAVTVTPPYPEPGDLLVASRNTDKGMKVVPMLVQDFRLTPLARLEDRTPGGRSMTEGAGFFSNNSGYLPWTWGTEVIDSFALVRVDARRAPPTPGGAR
jgi:hypothetical protein